MERMNDDFFKWYIEHTNVNEALHFDDRFMTIGIVLPTIMRRYIETTTRIRYRKYSTCYNVHHLYYDNVDDYLYDKNFFIEMYK